ncbi:MAG: hypothetical protein QM770_00170 [Tepidisphaeraceae bacterium]
MSAPSLGSVLGGNSVEPRSVVDGATGILFFDLNQPVVGNGTVDAWQIYAGQKSGIGQVELLIFRPGANSWAFVGASPLETVTWGSANTFALPSPIAVQTGDLVGWWYPQGTVPSVTYDQAVGQSLYNYNWASDPIPETHTDLPNLFTTAWHGPWNGDARTYSIQVLGTLPEPAVLSCIGLTALMLARRCR